MAAVLPSTSASPSPFAPHNIQYAAEYGFRITKLSQMDMQHALQQMIDVLLRPGEVYRATALRRQIKSQWARDDPAFIVLQSALLLVAATIWVVTYGITHGISLGHAFRCTVGVVAIEYLALGMAIATLTRTVANRWRIRRLYATEQYVEWMYAFDVHCNAFVPVFVLLCVAQYILSPMLLTVSAHPEDMKEQMTQTGQHFAFVWTLLADTLYAAAMIMYTYVTWLGYATLPFVDRAERMLYPIGVIMLLYLLSLLFNFNASTFTLGHYFDFE